MRNSNWREDFKELVKAAMEGKLNDGQRSNDNWRREVEQRLAALEEKADGANPEPTPEPVVDWPEKPRVMIEGVSFNVEGEYDHAEVFMGNHAFYFSRDAADLIIYFFRKYKFWYDARNGGVKMPETLYKAHGWASCKWIDQRTVMINLTATDHADLRRLAEWAHSAADAMEYLERKGSEQ